MRLRRNNFFRIVLSLFVMGCVSGLLAHPTFASDGIVETTFFGNLQDDGNGCGVYTILNLIVDIMTIGIGILAAIGITIVGIKYLTAKGNEEQTRKAKHRMFEIVIGLVAYALMYAGIQWLLPGGKLNTTSCTKLSDAEVATIRAAEKAEKEKEEKEKKANSGSKTTTGQKPKDYNKCMKNAAKVVRDEICLLDTYSERIARTAELLAHPYKTAAKKYTRSNSEYGYMGDKCFHSWAQIRNKTGKPTENFMKAYDQVRGNHFSLCSDKWGNHTSVGASCDVFAGTVVKAAGYDKNIGFGLRSQTPHLASSKLWKRVSNPKRGDFCNKDNHSSIYLGNNRVAEAGYRAEKGGEFGYIERGNCKTMDAHGSPHTNMRIYRATQ